MFQRILRWLQGYVASDEITILSFDSGVLRFTAQRNLRRHGTVPLGVRQADGTESLATLTMLPQEGEVWVARVVGGPELQKRLHELQSGGGRQERRRSPRQPRTLRVRSRDLPRYEGTTEDLSAGGARLAVEGELAPGTRLELDVQFDQPENTTLKLHGTVVWCRPRDARTWWVGVEFEPTP